MRALALLLALALPAAAQDRAALVEEGRALAIAGDCTACHGDDYAGGDPIQSPIGAIHATNITPDPATGIGDWTLEEFAALMRKGRAPDRMIYPAMPYVSYTGLSDRQIEALHTYFTDAVEPVVRADTANDLPFPFNIRAIMLGWNAFFLDEGSPPGAAEVQGPEAERGRLLVETLGHCSACHTPRGQLMQQVSERHLGGGMVSGWWAPNLTRGRGGLSDWSDDELAAFLSTGHTERAVAAGEMGLAVEHSLSLMPEADIRAIVAYLRAVPPVDEEDPPASAPTIPAPILSLAAAPPPSDWRAQTEHAGTEGAALYEAACAACHRSDGSGGGDFPSLRRISTVGDPHGATLVQVIAHGVDRQAGGRHALMPAFGEQFDHAQIAAVANHVRMAFGGVEGGLDADTVASILSGRYGVPLLIRIASPLAYAGLAAAGFVLLALGWWLWRRRRAAAAA